MSIHIRCDHLEAPVKGYEGGPPVELTPCGDVAIAWVQVQWRTLPAEGLSDMATRGIHLCRRHIGPALTAAFAGDFARVNVERQP